MTVTFVHIPRTGGLSLGQALRGSGVIIRGHQPRLSTVEGDAITIVRDPEARRRSLVAHWPDGPDWWFAPDAYWLDADRPLLWVGHTETLAEDFERLRDLLGLATTLPHINASRLP